MNPSNWKKVKSIFNSAFEREPKTNAIASWRKLVRVTPYCGSGCMNSLSHTTLRFLEPNTFTDERGTGGRLRTGSFLERYEIIRLLGAGGMGEVYLGRDQRLGRHVAIKILNAEFQKSESDVARFIQQAKAASALNHPNILTIHEIGHGAATKGVERI